MDEWSIRDKSQFKDYELSLFFAKPNSHVNFFHLFDPFLATMTDFFWKKSSLQTSLRLRKTLVKSNPLPLPQQTPDIWEKNRFQNDNFGKRSRGLRWGGRDWGCAGCCRSCSSARLDTMCFLVFRFFVVKFKCCPHPGWWLALPDQPRQASTMPLIPII